jgi:hypothetical protein
LRVSKNRAVVTALAAVAIAGSACTHAGHQGSANRSVFGGRAAGGATSAEGDDVTLDAGSVNADSSEVEIDSEDGVVKAKKDWVIRRGDRDFTWFGRTAGRNGSNVVVTVRGDDVSTSVETDKGEAVSHGTGKGKGKRTKVDPNVLKEETDPVAVPEAGAATEETVGEVTAQAATQIDVLILFNSRAVALYGSASAASTVAQRMIDKANKSFVDSQINLQYRLVRSQQIADAEVAPQVSWYGRNNLGNVVRSTTVANLRNQYGADLVQVWGNYTDVCGQGYQPTTGSVSASYGFNVINAMRSCTEGQAVSHELGHNLGGGHDRITSNRPSGGGDAYGMVNKQYRFLTIMGYPQSCGAGCVQTWTFSNPNVRYNGQPTGIAGSIDNARVINAIGPRVAAFRAPKV